MIQGKSQLARDAAASGDGVASTEALGAAVGAVLEAAIGAVGAAFGNVQLYDARRGVLEIVAHRGFRPEFLDLFAVVTPAGPSTTACARAFRRQQRVVIRDVEADPEFEPYLGIARLCGFKAVQSTPIIREGRVLGIMSTHFAEVTELAPQAQEQLDGYAAEMARLMVEDGGSL